jgi:hypothetical protein
MNGIFLRKKKILGEIGSVQNTYARRKLPGPTLVMIGGSRRQKKNKKGKEEEACTPRTSVQFGRARARVRGQAWAIPGRSAGFFFSISKVLI